jgi:hypothetical protein
MNPNETEMEVQPRGRPLIREDPTPVNSTDPTFEFEPPGVHPLPPGDPPGAPFEADPAESRPAAPARRTESKQEIPAAPLESGVKSDRNIGRLLSDFEIVPSIDPARIFRGYRKQLELGAALIEEGAIDSNHLEDALYEQQLRVEPLGKILIEKGRIDIDQLYTALGAQSNLLYRKLDGFRFEEPQKQELARIVGKNYARENLILPLTLEGTRLTLAVFMPEKAAGFHELQSVYSFLRMECVLIRPDVFQALFFSLYRSPLERKPDPGSGFESNSKADSKTDIQSTENIQAPSGIRSRRGEDSEPAEDERKRRIESEAVQTIHYLIKYALNSRAESVDIEQDLSGASIRLRVGGVLRMAELPWLEEKLPGLIGPIRTVLKGMAGLNASENRQPQIGVFTIRDEGSQSESTVEYDIRAAFCPTVCGENVTLRLFPGSSREIRLEDLDRSFHVLGPLKKRLDASRGLVVISGPDGSGKKETLYAAESSHDVAEAFPGPAPKLRTDDSAGKSEMTGTPAALEEPAPGLPVRFESMSWILSADSSDASLSPGEPNAVCIQELFEIYRAAAARSGNGADAAVPEAAVRFNEFIIASFEHIRRAYGCAQVKFSIENRGDRPELIAAPIPPDRKEC